MATAQTEFIRRSPRARIDCQVMVTLGANRPALGRAVDLSASGMALHAEQRLRPGDRVALLLDPHSLPTRPDEATLPPLSGSVAYVSRDGNRGGYPLYRVGICFAELPERVARQLSELSTRLVTTTEVAPQTPMADHQLAQSAAGRERLYQRALALLAGEDFAAARDAVRAALQVFPHTRHMRALLCRIDAESSLAAGNRDDALRSIRHGRVLAPDDAAWAELEGRVDDARPRRLGLWARLFGGAAPAKPTR